MSPGLRLLGAIAIILFLVVAGLLGGLQDLRMNIREDPALAVEVHAVSFPIPEQAGYKHFPNPASRYPIVGSFVAKTSDGVRVAITGAGACAYRQTEFEEAWADGDLDPDKIKDIKISDDGLNSDIHASAEYRAHLINVMTRRAIG